ncbi:hypothetical protein QTP88_001030 [Uroleucon formosanum]
MDEEGVRSITDLLGPDAIYEAIRQRLITTYSVPQATRFQRMVQPGGMGDRITSRLLRDMRDIYPDGMSDTGLVAFWLSKLPPPVRTVFAGLTGSGDFLAEHADRVWEAYQAAEISTVAQSSNNHILHEADSITQRTTPASSSEQDAQVQKRKVLWNKWDKKYKDRVVSDKAWDEVAKITKMTKEGVKKKWRGLRDTFLREKKKVKKSRSGDSQKSVEVYLGKWSYYKLMMFLNSGVTENVGWGGSK